MHRIETIGDAAGMRDLTKSEVAVYDGIGDLAPSAAAADYCVILVISPTAQSKLFPARPLFSSPRRDLAEAVPGGGG